MGSGTWYGFTNRSGVNASWLVWPPPSESYVSYGLLEAYQYTDNKAYFNTAKANLNHQLTYFPDGHVLTDNNTDRAYDLDLGNRFPERIGHLKMWNITSGKRHKDFSIKFHEAYDGEITTLYLHGISIIDILFYSYILKDEEALVMGISLTNLYWKQIGDDHYIRGYVGDGADNGKDYHQKRLMMDLLLWDMTSNQSYQKDAIESYHNLLKFWDDSPPYGFWYSLVKIEKSCFSIGFPALIDMTPPILREHSVNQLPTFSTSFTLDVYDPDYQWLDFILKGIGVNEKKSYVYYKASNEEFWSRKSFLLEDEKITTVINPYPPGTIIDYYFSLSDNFDNRRNSTIYTFEIQKTNLDSDGDGLLNYQEIFYTNTDVFNADTDRDFWNDSIDLDPREIIIPNLYIGVSIVVLIFIFYFLKLRDYMSSLSRAKKRAR